MHSQVHILPIRYPSYRAISTAPSSLVNFPASQHCMGSTLHRHTLRGLEGADPNSQLSSRACTWSLRFLIALATNLMLFTNYEQQNKQRKNHALCLCLSSYPPNMWAVGAKCAGVQGTPCQYCELEPGLSCSVFKGQETCAAGSTCCSSRGWSSVPSTQRF